VAVSTRNDANLHAFADKHGVEQRFTDYCEMFEKAKPDLVHVNTPPDVRLEVMAAAEAAKIPALIVEKPLAIEREDYEAIEAFAKTALVKIAINHQLHFHPRRQQLQQMVKSGEIGEVRMMDASAGMNMAYQGTHTLEAMSAFNPNRKPLHIFGQISGTEGLKETVKKHFAPDQTMASIVYDNGVSGLLRCGPNAPRVLPDDERTNVHKRIAVYGTKGFVHWTMWSWEVGVNGRIQSGTHSYGDEDILGQAAMTEAMFDWLEDDGKVHPLNLDNALRDFKTVLNIYTSALEKRPLSLDDAPAEGLIEALRNIGS
ncbi:MAG: Gfo/Idh/MocA family oxidoreductase, partial [Chloroflexota bacterium]